MKALYVAVSDRSTLTMEDFTFIETFSQEKLETGGRYKPVQSQSQSHIKEPLEGRVGKSVFLSTLFGDTDLAEKARQLQPF